MTKQLTQKELECLKLAATGMRQKEIAREIGAAVSTVNDRIERIVWKLKAENSTNAVYLAAKVGLI